MIESHEFFQRVRNAGIDLNIIELLGFRDGNVIHSRPCSKAASTGPVVQLEISDEVTPCRECMNNLAYVQCASVAATLLRMEITTLISRIKHVEDRLDPQNLAEALACLEDPERHVDRDFEGEPEDRFLLGNLYDELDRLVCQAESNLIAWVHLHQEALIRKLTLTHAESGQYLVALRNMRQTPLTELLTIAHRVEGNVYAVGGRLRAYYDRYDMVKESVKLDHHDAQEKLGIAAKLYADDLRLALEIARNL